MKVAVAFDDNLRNYSCTASKGYIADKWLIELGSASLMAFTPIFSSMFEDVVILPAGAEVSADDNRYVIVFSLERYSGCDVEWPIFGSSVAISFSADVMRGSELVVGSWEGHGVAFVSDFESRPKNETTYLAQMTEMAIRKAAADFVWQFEQDKNVLAWKKNAIDAANTTGQE